jgi:DNA-binding CsgD family transcriptional regulator
MSTAPLRELYSLTPVEAEIARLICQGLAPAAVADHLRLSVHTVRDYLKPIFQKMGVRRQVDMVRVAASFAGLFQLAQRDRPRPKAPEPGGQAAPGPPRRFNS